MRRGVSARTLTGLTRRARPRGKAGDPFLLLRNMLRLAQQRGCFSEPVPLQGVPSLKLNINSKQKLCFYNLAVHLPEGRRPQTGSQSQPQESEMSESWQRKTERDRTLWTGALKELGVPLSLLFSFARESNFLRSDFFLFCPSAPGKKKQANKSSETNGFHIRCILSYYI